MPQLNKGGKYVFGWSVIGAEVQALGARMRIKCASVGAIWSMVTGVWIMAGFTECPMKINGEGI